MPERTYRVHFLDASGRVTINIPTAFQALKFFDELLKTEAVDIRVETSEGEPLLREDLVMLLAKRRRAQRSPIH